MHGSLIDYRFRVKNCRSDHSTSMRYKDGDTFMENGILVELKYVDLHDDYSPETAQRRRNAKWVPNNIAEYFFFDDYGFLSISERKIKDCYNEFT